MRSSRMRPVPLLFGLILLLEAGGCSVLRIHEEDRQRVKVAKYATRAAILGGLMAAGAPLLR